MPVRFLGGDTIAVWTGMRKVEAAVSSNSEWEELCRQASEGVEEWRRQHPKATFLEIAVAVDEQLSRMRARMLEDLAIILTGTPGRTGG